MDRHGEYIRYFVIGCATTLVSWVSYALYDRMMQGWDASLHVFGHSFLYRILVAGGLSWFTAVVFAFFTNKVWVFESRSFKPSVVFAEALKFFGARVLTGILESVAVPVIVGLGFDAMILGIEGFWAKVIMSVAVFVLNYIFSKFIVFRRS